MRAFNPIAVVAFFTFICCIGQVHGQMKPGWQFRNELLRGISPLRDTEYIENRSRLEKLSKFSLYDTIGRLSTTTLEGDKISIEIKTTRFKKNKHRIEYPKQNGNDLSGPLLIDKKSGYGFEFDLPVLETKYFRLKWNGQEMTIPDSALHDLYDLGLNDLCGELPTAYYSKKRDLLYIYISGGDGSASYCVKFIFNRTEYLARIIGKIECVQGYDFIDALPDACQ